MPPKDIPPLATQHKRWPSGPVSATASPAARGHIRHVSFADNSAVASPGTSRLGSPVALKSPQGFGMHQREASGYSMASTIRLHSDLSDNDLAAVDSGTLGAATPAAPSPRLAVVAPAALQEKGAVLDHGALQQRQGLLPKLRRLSMDTDASVRVHDAEPEPLPGDLSPASPQGVSLPLPTSPILASPHHEHKAEAEKGVVKDRSAHAATRVGAMLLKNLRQKLRAKVSVAAETLLPVFFVLGLVFIWANTNTDPRPATQFVSNETDISLGGALGELASFFCASFDPRDYNATALANTTGTTITVGNQTIDIGANITQILLDAGEIRSLCTAPNPTCFATLPVGFPIPGTGDAQVPNTGEGAFCLNGDFDTIANYVQVPRPWRVFTLDVMYLLQRLARSDGIPAIASELFFFRALRNSGLLYFSPVTEDVRRFVAFLNATSATFDRWFGGILPTDEATSKLRSDAEADAAWGLVEVEHLNEAQGSEVTIRLRRNGIPLTDRLLDRFELGLGLYNSRVYVLSGFLTLQNAVASYYLTEVLNLTTALPGSNLARQVAPGTSTMIPMPYGAYTDSPFLDVAGTLAPLAMVFGFLYSVSQLTKRLVEEKETRAREAMMIMGLDTFSFFLSWIITYVLINLVTAFAIATVCKVTFLAKATFLVMVIFFFLFGVTTSVLAILLSTFFSQSREAALVAPVVFFLLAIPSFALSTSTDIDVLLGLSVLSPTCFSIGAQVLFGYERSTGLTMDNLAAGQGGISMLTVLVYLCADIVIYLVLALYLDAVLPREWGTPRHPCFFVIDPYRWGRAKLRTLRSGKSQEQLDREAMYGTDSDEDQDPPEEGMRPARRKLRDGRNPAGVFEARHTRVLSTMSFELDATPSFDASANAGPSAARPVVKLRALRKEFGGGSLTNCTEAPHVAVKDLTFDLYDNEVTVLLGHNGAGKTTAINCMTGMIKPTSGDCRIYGRSAKRDLARARERLGICPQHNILWEGLTCREHLQFFAMLKGVPWSEQNAVVDDMLTATDLGSKADCFAHDLSGGQKRKLSVAIAFIGGSRFVILDEPTAGMDVAARRFTWDLIKAMTPGRSILLTTHFMDEADLLGDNIAIMSKGRLECSGSSLFLKSRLGAGYSLVIVLEKSGKGPTVDIAAAAEAIVAEVQAFVPMAEVTSANASELLLHLPMAAVPLFPPMLRMLEDRGHDLGVQGHALSVTSLEEVFLKVGEDAPKPSPDPDPGTDLSVAPPPPRPVPAHKRENSTFFVWSRHQKDKEKEKEASSADSLSSTPTLDTGGAPTASLTAQFSATVYKRFHNMKRDRRTQVLQVFLPVAGIALAMLLTLINLTSAPRMVMSVDQYNGVESLVAGCSPEFVANIPGDDNPTVMPTGTRELALSTELLQTISSHPRSRVASMLCVNTTGIQNSDSALPDLLQSVGLFTNESRYRHAAPLALSQWHNTLARTYTTAGAPSLIVANHPLPMTEDDSLLAESTTTFFISVFIMIPFTFIPSTFVVGIVKERETKSRHLQDVSGLNYVVYWVANFTFDAACFLITTVMALLVFLIFRRDEYVGTWENFGATTSLLLLYGIAGVTGSYLSSFLFMSHATAQNAAMMGNFICGFLMVLATFLMSLLEDTEDLGKSLVWIFRLVPAFCLGNGIVNMATQEVWAAVNTDNVHSPFSTKVNGWNLLFMGLEGPLFFALTLLIDHPTLKAKLISFLGHMLERFRGPSPCDAGDDVPEDEDVQEERARIERTVGTADGDLITVQHLHKEYRGADDVNVAVRDLSFGVARGEVFGFLGTNGAGKTTTMSILCGEQLPSSGEAYIVGHNVVDEAAQARTRLGYCPQFDALFDLLTVDEHLFFYARLRGLQGETLNRVVEQLVARCGLAPHRAKQANQLSGGNKRKLSVAIALVGGPDVLFLDEPSAGMDPTARRGLWNVIQSASAHCAVVLTTHHLEEVEALAKRAAIMHRGRMMCIGSLQHLKAKYGKGFEVSLRVEHEHNLPLLEDAVAAMLSGLSLPVDLLERQGRRLTYSLPATASLASVLDKIQALRAELPISDFSVAQSSLDSVFLRISTV